METLYDDDFLIQRALDKLEGKQAKKFTIKPPQVKTQNKKTFVANFKEICQAMNRDEEMLRNFFEKQLNKGTGDVTLSATSVLTIAKSYSQKDVETVLRDFAKKYVICKEQKCGSGTTELVKENRITYLVCVSCNCKVAIK